MATELDQLLQLLDEQDARIRRAFLQFVAAVRSDQVLADLVDRLEANDLQGALRIVDSYVANFANVIPEVIRAVGVATAVELKDALGDVALAIGFDPTNPRAAALAASSRTRLIREFSTQQYQATQQAISRGIASGAGAQETARAIRNSLGLTANQEAFVESYRQQLQRLDARVLERALRDRRFDGRIEEAVARSRPLTQRQIDTMVDRYRARALAMRAETISRTEALTAYSQAREEALEQMVEQTRISRDRINRIWHSTHDERVRDWHASMEGQKQPMGRPFTDGLGNSLRYPGDPAAPGDTRINCRCALGFEVLPAA